MGYVSVTREQYFLKYKMNSTLNCSIFVAQIMNELTGAAHRNVVGILGFGALHLL